MSGCDSNNFCPPAFETSEMEGPADLPGKRPRGRIPQVRLLRVRPRYRKAVPLERGWQGRTRAQPTVSTRTGFPSRAQPRSRISQVCVERRGMGLRNGVSSCNGSDVVIQVRRRPPVKKVWHA